MRMEEEERPTTDVSKGVPSEHFFITKARWVKGAGSGAFEKTILGKENFGGREKKNGWFVCSGNSR